MARNSSPFMQHRHYKAIADLVAKHTALTAYTLADMFAADNDRFDRDRFLAACKGQPINGRDKVNTSNRRIVCNARR